MFIKKDLRKIPTILEEAIDCSISDENDENDTRLATSKNEDKHQKRIKREEPLRVLKLGRRKQEFEGSVKVLCQPSHVPKLKHLSVLNLYDCDIHDLTGFGPMFGEAAPNLETLNLGRNPLSEGIPEDFAQARSLKHLWLDDCKLTGKLPKALLNLPYIESLRLPNNNITHVEIGGGRKQRQREKESLLKHLKNEANGGEEFEFECRNDDHEPMVPLQHLKILCLDKNQMGSSKETKAPALPPNLAEWAPHLEELFLRHNELERLWVEDWPDTLKVLHVSSNSLTTLNEVFVEGSKGLPSLTHLYANGNQLVSLPEGIWNEHSCMERLVVSHNPPLKDLPEQVWDWIHRTKTDDPNTATREILWQPNPNLKAPTRFGSTIHDDPKEMDE